MTFRHRLSGFRGFGMNGKNIIFKRFKWHLIVIYAAVAILIIIAILTDIFRTDDSNQVPIVIWVAVWLMIVSGILMLLMRLTKVLQTIQDSNHKFESMCESLEKVRSSLLDMEHDLKLNGAIKSIIYSDLDIRALREVIFNKLQKKDFDAVKEIISQIEKLEPYHKLAAQLSDEVHQYIKATDNEKVTQVVSHIEDLLNQHLWIKASEQIEQLVRSAPNSEQALLMRQKLIDKKQERKKILLNAWDDAVQRQATDRSIEILKELDLYLTTSEALALQEAARDVFRNKLHNLGVRFSMAVSGKHWSQAIETGQDIMRNFPNSKMAEEIRSKMSALCEKAGI